MRQRLIASIALVLLPATAGAERLLYGGRSEVFWTDNAFGTAEDALAGQAEVVPDWAARLAPWADLGDYDGELTWGLRYAPTYEYYLDQSDLEGFDHDVGGRLGWRIGDRTTLRLSERYQRYHGLTSFNEVNPDTHVVTGTVGERQEIEANVITGSLAHQLGPRDEVTLSVSQNLYDQLGEVVVGEDSDGTPVTAERPKHSFLGASLLYDHQLSERATIGSRASWGRQTVERVDPPLLDPLAEPSDLPDLVTDFYNLSGVFTYRFSPTFDMELSAGPALIDGTADQLDPARNYQVAQFPLRSDSDGGLHFIDANTCKEISPGVRVVGPKCQAIDPALTPAQLFALNFNTNNNTSIVPFEGVVPSIEDSSTTYFADVRFNKQWERWTGTLAYVRSASQSSTIASVSDYLTGELRWQIAERWTADLSAGFERREQASENTVLVTQVENQDPPTPFDSAARALSVRAATVDNSSHVDVLGLNLRVNYQLARRSTLYANVGWQDETQVFEAFEQQAKRLALTVGINFNFDPVNF